MNTRKTAALILLLSATGAAAAGCGSSASPPAHHPRTHPSTPVTSPSVPPTSPSSAAAEQAIKTNWAAFFSASTPLARRVALLEHGSTFESAIKTESHIAFASSASAKVTKVTLVSPTQADVVYTILVSGHPVKANQHGVAVYQDGTWKVGTGSFCGLLALASGGSTSSLPAACHGAG